MQVTEIKTKTTVAIVGLVAGLAVGILWVNANKQGLEPASEFWQQLAFGGGTVEVEYHSSLEDAVRSADLVITGTVDSIRFGRTWGDASVVESQVASILMDITVSEVLRGTLAESESVVTVERQVLGRSPDDLKALIQDDGIMTEGRLAAVPSGEALFVLRTRGDAGSEIVAAKRPAASGITYRLINSQGLITQKGDGTAALPLSTAHLHESESSEGRVPEHYFAESVLGVTFENVVTRARETN